VGALFAGLLADRFGLQVAVLATAALTAASGLSLWRRMPGPARAQDSAPMGDATA
jgi:predicted MFS family arabinose efflux permease